MEKQLKEELRKGDTNQLARSPVLDGETNRSPRELILKVARHGTNPGPDLDSG